MSQGLFGWEGSIPLSCKLWPRKKSRYKHRHIWIMYIWLSTYCRIYTHIYIHIYIYIHNYIYIWYMYNLCIRYWFHHVSTSEYELLICWNHQWWPRPPALERRQQDSCRPCAENSRLNLLPQLMFKTRVFKHALPVAYLDSISTYIYIYYDLHLGCSRVAESVLISGGFQSSGRYRPWKLPSQKICTEMAPFDQWPVVKGM